MTLLLIAVALVFSSALVAVAVAPSAPSRVVDRTFVCTPVAYGGVRDLDLRASPTQTDPRTNPPTIPAYLIARTGTSGWDTNLVFVRARVHARIGITSPEAGPGGVYASARRCSLATTKMPLSAKGLAGPPTRYWSTKACPVAGRVLVRVRALLAAAAGWQRIDATFFGAEKRVVEASLAVRTERTGEPLAFMQLDEAGKTTLWSSPRCA
ncbi:MAG: hypothetical protein M3546_01840 [Actinomycetota bacterium]|nr:hypothetical protein [Actinomycetota bacterium]